MYEIGEDVPGGDENFMWIDRNPYFEAAMALFHIEDTEEHDDYPLFPYLWLHFYCAFSSAMESQPRGPRLPLVLCAGSVGSGSAHYGVDESQAGGVNVDDSMHHLVLPSCAVKSSSHLRR